MLQWLDELDDLAAASLFLWHRLSAGCLLIGLVAALLAHFPGLDFGVPVPYPFIRLALGCILVWSCGGLLAANFDRRITSAA